MGSLNFLMSGLKIDLKPHKIEGTFLTNTMIAAFMVAAALIIFGLCIRIFCIPRWKRDVTKITPLQTFLEWIIGAVTNNSKENLGHNHKFISEWYSVLMCYVFVGIMVEFFGIRSPLSDINMTLVLGLMTFVLIHVYGFKERKLKRFGHFKNPIFWISDAIVPLSIALRLFGNVFSGYAVMHLIHMMPSTAGWIVLRVALTLPALFMFTAFHALIQSYVYMVLSISFISEATE